MNEIEKTRLRLAIVFLSFVIFIFCVIFGAVKIYHQMHPAETPMPQRLHVEQPQVVKKITKNKPAAIIKKTPPKKRIELPDSSRAFRGILPAWKKYRRPKCGILADVTNNKIIWSYNAEKVVPIASMSKMLTLYIALDAVKRSPDLIKLSNKVKITQNSAMGREGGFGFVSGSIYTLEDLMRAAVIRSANDAAGAVAVYIGGSEKKFVEMMNVEAAKLGMKKSSFINPHGLPEKNKDNLSTMNDMLLLSLNILKEPDYMRWAKLKAVKIGERTIVNTNNLMRKRKYPGVDGLKTGYTRRAGFCLAFSCIRDGRRLVGVGAGFPSSVDRENFVTALLDWAYHK